MALWLNLAACITLVVISAVMLNSMNPQSPKLEMALWVSLGTAAFAGICHRDPGPSWTQTFVTLSTAGLLIVFTRLRWRPVLAERRRLRIAFPSAHLDVIELASLARTPDEFQQVKLAAVALMAADGRDRRGHVDAQRSIDDEFIESRFGKTS